MGGAGIEPERFKTLANDCLESVREKDSGTFQYDWFLDDDERECVVREAYFGDPTPELMEVSEGIDVTVYRYFQGL